MARKISEIVGRGYDDFLTTRCFYRVVKGSKGSKKSKTAALDFISKIVAYPGSNLLVIRRYFSDIRDSCFQDLQWAIEQLGFSEYWNVNKARVELEYKPTKQKILFRGLDDASKIASISVAKGHLCWVWFEEASQITNEKEFDKICMSIRGRMDPALGLWKQVTITFNPWSEHHWLKARFFDKPKRNVFYDTTTFRDNEFLDDVDIQRYLDMYVENPRLARVICDGDWGIAEGLVYTDWEESEFDYREVLEDPDVVATYGLDFGFVASYNAFAAVLVNMKTRTLWVYDEMYVRGKSNVDIAKQITLMGYGKETIYADSAEPKSIYELQTGLYEVRNGFVDEEDDDIEPTKWALPNVKPALKGPDSKRNGIQRLQGFHWIVHPSCKNTIMELNNYCYDTDKDGNFKDEPIKDYDHCLDSIRYSLAPMLLNAHGVVVEAKGQETPMLTEDSGHRKSKRVVATTAD